MQEAKKRKENQLEKRFSNKDERAHRAVVVGSDTRSMNFFDTRERSKENRELTEGEREINK